MNTHTIPQPTTTGGHAARLRQAAAWLDEHPDGAVHLPGMSSNMATSTLSNMGMSGQFVTGTFQDGIYLTKVQP